MFVIFEQVLILFLFVLTGYALSKGKICNSDHVKLLSALVVYVFLPALSFRNFAARFTPEYLAEKYPLLLVSIGLLLLSIPLSKLTARLLTKHPYEQAIYRYTLTIPNFGYIGYALAESLYGSGTLLDVLIFALPMSFYTNSVGYCMLTSPGGKKFSPKQLLTPPTIAALVGCVIGLTRLKLPGVLDQCMEKASACAAPVSMLLTGIVISEFNLRELLTRKTAYLVVALRLLVTPLLVFGLLKLSNLSFALTAAVIIYSMPCGMNTIIFPRLVGEDCKLGASLVVIATLASLVTIPLCLYFLIPA